MFTLQRYRPYDYQDWIIDEKDMITLPPQNAIQSNIQSIISQDGSVSDYDKMQLDHPAAIEDPLKKFNQIASLSLSLIK